MSWIDPLISLWKNSAWARSLQNGRCWVWPYFGERGQRRKIKRGHVKINFERECASRVRCSLTSSSF